VPKDQPQLVDVATGKPITQPSRALLQTFLASKGLKTTGSLRVLSERAAGVASLPLPPTKAKAVRSFAMNTNRLHDAIRNWIARDWHVLKDVTSVYIEHQPVLKNPTMKTVQFLVYATLRERLLAAHADGGTDVSFHFTHASTKVKGCTGLDGDAGYASRKAFARSRTLRFLEQSDADTDNHTWWTWLMAQKKTDDLSDAFCMLLDAVSTKAPSPTV